MVAHDPFVVGGGGSHYSWAGGMRAAVVVLREKADARCPRPVSHTGRPRLRARIISAHILSYLRPYSRSSTSIITPNETFIDPSQSLS